MKYSTRHLVIIAGCLILGSCNQTTEIPFPVELTGGTRLGLSLSYDIVKAHGRN